MDWSKWPLFRDMSDYQLKVLMNGLDAPLDNITEEKCINCMLCTNLSMLFEESFPPMSVEEVVEIEKTEMEELNKLNLDEVELEYQKDAIRSNGDMLLRGGPPVCKGVCYMKCFLCNKPITYHPDDTSFKM